MPAIGKQAQLDEAWAQLEQHRLHELSRGMMQQVYNDNTYRLEIWGWLYLVLGHVLRTSHGVYDIYDVGVILSWEYEPNIVKMEAGARSKRRNELHRYVLVHLHSGELEHSDY